MAQITLEELLEQIEPINVDWMDETAEMVLETTPRVISRLKRSEINQKTIESLLVEEDYALDLFRLFLDISQDILLNIFKKNGIKGDFRTIRHKCRSQSEKIGEILIESGLIEAIEYHIGREWKLEDVLLERYKQMRGSAIRGQHRGSALEDAVENVLKEINNDKGIPYESRTNFVNSYGKASKADFMIPSRERPKIIIEAKAYEATGSKLTDVLGDILKILEVKDPETRFFFVTDGIGWYRRISDLRKIVEHHQHGEIEMIYTRKTLHQLKRAIMILEGDE